MKRLLLGIAFALCLFVPQQAFAQAIVLSSCGSKSLSAGARSDLFVDTTGVLCTSGSVGSANIATNQISVDTTSGGKLLAALRTGRTAITIENHGTTPVYIGISGVTTSTGILLPGVVGASVTIATSAALYGIVASGSQTVGVLEAY